ncbi:MAG: DUF2085 domain-containing protein [Chloroflexi bacterium]|jgi:uncharacterized membrane protein|nr:DUF2085 domain-containing protein [Chloroflexota bacterium]BCY18608.1 hypothetical protein hrd7_24570 [Leptolinea sp. HRD-7]
MVTVTLYRKNECDECDIILQYLDELQKTHPHQLAIVNVEQLDDDQQGVDKARFPYVKIGPYVLHSPFRKTDLQIALGASIDRASHLESVNDETYRQRINRGHTVSTTDRVSFWISKNFMSMVLLVIFLYAGLPFIAPILMKTGQTGPAKVIYAIYSPLCHQLGFRSWFLFGEQLFYPRKLAGIAGVKSFEEQTGISSDEIFKARSYLGDEITGYKVALCERDTAIYIAMFLFGLVFVLTGKRIKALPWIFWLTIGLIPIGVDGFSQLPSLASAMPSWLPIRESTPLLRVITGGLFGLTTAWFLFPLLEESMKETRTLLSTKMSIAKQLASSEGKNK